MADLATGRRNVEAGGRDLNDLGADEQGKWVKKGLEEGDGRSVWPPVACSPQIRASPV